MAWPAHCAVWTAGACPSARHDHYFGAQFASIARGVFVMDAPSYAPSPHHFDYDVCLVDLRVGPDGPLAEAARASTAANAPRRWATSDAGAAESSPPALVRQYNEVSHQLTMLTARLESAGVLPAACSPEFNSYVGAGTSSGNDPPPMRNNGRRHRVPSQSVVCGGLLLLSQGWAHFGLCLFSLVPLGAGEGGDSPEEPVPPSSPDFTDITAPTPAGEIAGDEASTSAPAVGAVPLAPVPFDHSLLPVCQCRVLAFLNEVNCRESQARPFVPEGCPITIHNPFTRNRQCDLLSPEIYSGQTLRFLLQDFASRRGWQPLLAVQPQPDEHALHFIPAAADSSLASVVLRTDHGLHPICLPRILPTGPSRSLTVAGRWGRLREPYPLCRNQERPVHLRDGDCLLLDSGPFGPPPLEPVAIERDLSSVGLRLRPAVLLFALVLGRSSFGRILLLVTAHHLAPAGMHV